MITNRIKRGANASLPNGAAGEPLFTTDTYDLYIGKGDGTNQRYQKYMADAINGTGVANQLAYFSGANTIAGSTFLTLNLTADNGYLILTGGATYKNADIWLNRYSNAWENAIRFQTNGTTDWYVGSSATGSNSDFEIYNYGTTSNGIKIAKATNNVTVGGTLTATVGALATAATNFVTSDSGTLKSRTAAQVLSDIGAQATSEKGQNNGYASLDSGGKVPVAQLPNSIMEYKGNWNATTNTPTLADGTGNAGDVYLCNVAGTVDLGSGNITFAVGDWCVYNGSIWQKSINSNAVVSVNGQTGVVTITDITGNAGTATKLATARTLTIGATGRTFDGSADRTWTLADIGAQAALTNPVTGTGTLNYITKFTATGSSVGNSVLFDDGTNIGLNTASPSSYNHGGTNRFLEIRNTGTTTNSQSHVILSTNSTVAGAIGSLTWAIPNTSNARKFAAYIGSNITQDSSTAPYGNIFFGVANGSTEQIAMTINPDKTIRMHNYTTNGFVKFTGSDGTLDVDTTSYTNGTGTNNYVSKFTTTGSTLGNSSIFDNGTFVGIGTATSFTGGPKLYVNKTTVSEEIFRVDGQSGLGALVVNNNATGVDTYIGQSLSIGSSGSATVIKTLLTLGTEGSQPASTAGYDFLYRFRNTTGYSEAIIRAIDSGYSTTYRTSLSFLTSNATDGTASEKMSINHAGTIRMNSYTTNGFVKFSGTNGTLAVDTNTYLTTAVTSLTGGTGVTVSASTGSVTVSIGQSVATNASPTFNRIVTGGLYGTGSTGVNIPIWQFDASNTGYGIVYNEGTNDTIRIDVSGNVLTGIPDVLIGENYMNINGNIVYHAGNIPTWNQNTTGNAATATKLETARTLTIGAIGKTFDGSANVSWSLAEIGAQAALTNPVTGTGTNNYITKFTTTGSTVGNSVLFDDGTNIGLNTSSPSSYTHGGTNRFIEIRNTNTTSNSQSHLILSTNATANTGAIGSITWAIPNTANTKKFAGYIGCDIASDSTTNPYGTMFMAVANGSDPVVAISLLSDRTVKLGKYTTNGFVKFSAGDGTLAVDTASYLPLTGGTLTGALNGTSGTFSTQLSVSGSINEQLTLSYTTASGGFTWQSFRINGTNKYRIFGNTDNSFTLFSDVLSSNVLLISSTGASTFNSSVGIGGTSPANFNGLTFTGPFLDVSGILQIKGTSANTIAGLQFGGDTYRKAIIYSTIGTETPALVFGIASSGTSSGASEAMRITSSKNVGIGNSGASNLLTIGADVATHYTQSGIASMTLKATAGTARALFEIHSADGATKGVFQAVNGYAVNIGALTASNVRIENTAGLIMINTSGNVGVGTTSISYKLDVSGDVRATTGFYDTSDMRLKSNIQDYSCVDILKISAKIYEKNGKIEIGYLAQDIQGILDSAISISEDGYLNLQYRQVHTAKIAALEAKIKELESKLN